MEHGRNEVFRHVGGTREGMTFSGTKVKQGMESSTQVHRWNKGGNQVLRQIGGTKEGK